MARDSSQLTLPWAASKAPRKLPFGFPPDPVFVDAYVHLLGDSGLPWMAACYGGDVLPIAEHVIRHGGHVRVGLEDDASDQRGRRIWRWQVVAGPAERSCRAPVRWRGQ